MAPLMSRSVVGCVFIFLWKYLLMLFLVYNIHTINIIRRHSAQIHVTQYFLLGVGVLECVRSHPSRGVWGMFPKDF